MMEAESNPIYEKIITTFRCNSWSDFPKDPVALNPWKHVFCHNWAYSDGMNEES